MINITSIYNRCRIQRMLLVAGLGWQSVCTAARLLKKKGKCWGDPELESWGYSWPDSRGFSNLDTPISKRFYGYLWLDARELLASAVCWYGSLLSHKALTFPKSRSSAGYWKVWVTFSSSLGKSRWNGFSRGSGVPPRLLFLKIFSSTGSRALKISSLPILPVMIR